MFCGVLFGFGGAKGIILRNMGIARAFAAWSLRNIRL